MGKISKYVIKGGKLLVYSRIEQVGFKTTSEKAHSDRKYGVKL